MCIALLLIQVEVGCYEGRVNIPIQCSDLTWGFASNVLKVVLLFRPAADLKGGIIIALAVKAESP